MLYDFVIPDISMNKDPDPFVFFLVTSSSASLWAHLGRAEWHHGGAANERSPAADQGVPSLCCTGESLSCCLWNCPCFCQEWLVGPCCHADQKTRKSLNRPTFVGDYFNKLTFLQGFFEVSNTETFETHPVLTKPYGSTYLLRR